MEQPLPSPFALGRHVLSIPRADVVAPGGRAVTFNETRRGGLPGVIEMIALLSGIADVCKAL
jgi:hypothetical protein